MISKAVVDQAVHLANESKKHDKLYISTHLPDCMQGDVPCLEEERGIYEDQRFVESLRALYAYLNNLNYENVKDLLALMYLGRGDAKFEETTIEQFNRLRQLVDEECWQTDKRIIINELIENILLCNYLEKSIEIMRI